MLRPWREKADRPPWLLSGCKCLEASTSSSYLGRTDLAIPPPLSVRGGGGSLTAREKKGTLLIFSRGTLSVQSPRL